MRHRVQHVIHAGPNPEGRELLRIFGIVRMFPGIAEVHVVADDDTWRSSCSIHEVARPKSKEGNRYVQAQQKVVDQTEAVAGGHAVRAMYMYSGMADVAALTGDMAYVNSLDRIWDNVAGRKLHVTGGVGARGGRVVRQ